MDQEQVASKYQQWLEDVDAVDRDAVLRLADDPEQQTDAFYRDLAFGTAGLRGVIGMGSNRMNVYTVAQATQGLANYLNRHYENPAVAVCRDSRLMGEVFMQEVAGVLAANGVRAYLYPRIEPTPALSFATRDLQCQAGINITASHNPAEYNGYKVYGPDGCQITSEAAAEIQRDISNIDIFADVKRQPFDRALQSGMASWIAEDTLDRFVDAVMQQSLDDDASQPLSVVYTPLNGTGLECVIRTLRAAGVDDVTVVPEQADPDGNFPTCPYPNPEIREALQKGLELCEQVHPDLLLATDPDADRVGIAVPHDGDYKLLTGNEVGALLLDFVCQRRRERGEDLRQGIAVTTIVSSSMVDAIAKDYGIEMRRVLTGFKYIGEQIGMLEAVGQEGRFLFGFEESYGYLAGSHVRDKDAVVASLLICQLARWHRAQGRDLYEAMQQLYQRYGFFRNKTVSLSYPGAQGAQKMADLMASLRSTPPATIAGMPVQQVVDYGQGASMPRVNGQDEQPQTLPQADVVEFDLEEGVKLIVRPSGTEPKIKAYVFAKAATDAEALAMENAMEQAARELLA